MAINTYNMKDQIHSIVYALLRTALENNIKLRLDYPAWILPQDEYKWVGTFMMHEEWVKDCITLRMQYNLITKHIPWMQDQTRVQTDWAIPEQIIHDLKRNPHTPIAEYIHNFLQGIDPTDIETEMQIKEAQIGCGVGK